MEEKVDSDYAVFWVEVADDLSSSDATIYIYYGKSDATYTDPQTHGENTFLFFDDFPGTSLNTDKWTNDWTYGSGGSITVADSILKIKAASTTTGKAIKSDVTFTLPYAYRAKVKHPLVTSLRHGMFKSTNTNPTVNGENYAVFQTADDPTVDYTTEADGTNFAKDTQDWDNTNFLTWDILRDSNGNSDFYINGAVVDNDHDYSSTDETIIRVVAYKSTTEIEVDWVLIRKYVDPEPSHGSWGTEESEPQECSHAFTETLSPSAILNQWQEQFRIWIETVYPSATMNYWQEVSYTYTQTVTATETVTYLQEHIRVMHESLSPSEYISYWQEQKHVFSEIASPTATLNRWLEGMHVFFGTVHSSTTLSHWIEVVFRFTEPLSVSEQLQPIQVEAVFTLTQTITPSETVTYLQEQQYVLTETAAPTTTFEHWIEGINVFTETFTETLQQTATVHYWIEISQTLTETFSPQTLLETVGEVVYVLTETLTETAQNEIAQELLQAMVETLKPTTVFNYAKELVETFITNIETVHAQATLYKQIFTPTEEINTALVLAAFAAAIAIIALSLTITKKD